MKGQSVLIDDGVECITSATIVDVHYLDGVGEHGIDPNIQGIQTQPY